MAEVGHNSGAVASGRIVSLVERLERLGEEAENLKADTKFVYDEAKSEGFDTKTLRKLIALRKKDKAKLQEEKAVLELYASALGCLDLV